MNDGAEIRFKFWDENKNNMLDNKGLEDDESASLMVRTLDEKKELKLKEWYNTGKLNDCNINIFIENFKSAVPDTEIFICSG